HDELLGPRQAERQQLTSRERALAHPGDVLVLVCTSDLGPRRGRRRLDSNARQVLGALADEPVLRERELVARRQRIGIHIVRERAQCAYLQARTWRPAVSLRPTRSVNVAVSECAPFLRPLVFQSIANTPPELERSTPIRLP